MPGYTWLPDAAWRGALVLAAAFAIARLLRQQPAAVRHILWTGALAGVVAMPLLAAFAPLTVPVVVPDQVRALTPAIVSAPVAGQARPSGSAGETERPAATSDAASSAASGGGDPRPTASWFDGWSVQDSLLLAWLLGVVVMSSRLLLGFRALGRLARRGSAPDESVAMLADACAARVGLHAAPRVLVTRGVAMPCAAGWLRPVILLPEESAAWSSERLEVVLLHELSHVRRMDIVPHLLSELALVLHWFNPLVWLAAARLRAEAERATDDRVVHVGARPSEYASHLLEIVRQARRAWHPAPLMPLARRSEFEGRMLAILESRGALPRARWALGTFLVISGLSVGVASMEGAPSSKRLAPAVVPDGVTRQAEPAPAPTQSSATRSGSTAAALAEALRDPVASVREAAANALGNARDSIAVRALMEVLRTDESAQVRRAAAWSLGEIADAQAIPALADALTRDRDADVRKNAASALGNIDSPRATSALTTALERDSEVAVRIQAAEALSNIKDGTALDALIRVLDRDDDPGVRRAVLEAINNLEGSRAMAAVSRALRDANAEVRLAAAEALGSMDDREAVPALMAAARDADPEVRRAVIHSLASLSDRRSVSVLVTALADTDVEVRRAAAEGFGNIDNLRTAPPELIRAMDDRDAEVRHAVAHALGHIEDPDAIRVLIAHIGDPNAEVRQAVVESLDQFDDPAVDGALRTALKDTDPEVRKRAAEALGNRKGS